MLSCLVKFVNNYFLSPKSNGTKLNFLIQENLIFNNCSFWGEEEEEFGIETGPTIDQIRPEIQEGNCKIIAAMSAANLFFAVQQFWRQLYDASVNMEYDFKWIVKLER